MKWPPDAPAWLKAAVDNLVERAEHSIQTDEPARAAGYFTAVLHLKESILAEAESEDARKKKELRELTWEGDGKSVS